MQQLPMDRVRRALSVAVQQGRRTGGRRGNRSLDDERCKADGGGGACRTWTGAPGLWGEPLPVSGFYHYPSGRFLSEVLRAFIDFMHGGEEISAILRLVEFT
jgi:hypothetical protein